MFSYTFSAMARYQEKDKLEPFEFNTFADSQEEAYKDIKANADKVCCEYRNLRLTKITTCPKYKPCTAELSEPTITIWEERKQIKHKKKFKR